jgi:hypothetical protein
MCVEIPSSSSRGRTMDTKMIMQLQDTAKPETICTVEGVTINLEFLKQAVFIVS